MDYNKGKGEKKPKIEDEEEEIDLTLKLGQSIQYNQNEEAGGSATATYPMHDSSTAYCHSSTAMTNRNEYGGSSIAYSTGGYLVYHQGMFNPTCTLPTTPTRKRSSADTNKVCKACGSKTTPLWRKGPDGPQTLCNACGLRHLRTIKRAGD